jgi:hypothetical protein
MRIQKEEGLGLCKSLKSPKYSLKQYYLNGRYDSIIYVYVIHIGYGNDSGENGPLVVTNC